MSEKLDRIEEALEEVRAAVVLRDNWLEMLPDVLTALDAIHTVVTEIRDAVKHIMDQGCSMRCQPPDGEPTPREGIADLQEIRRAASR